WHADPIHMLPDNSFWGGTAVCAILLTWGPGMYVARVLAVTLRQQFGEQYVLTALGKGLGWKTVVFRHILRNTWPKLVLELPAVYTMAMSGLVAVEFIGMREQGAVFGALQALGHAGLGFSTLWTSPAEFHITALTAYLTFFSLFTAVTRGIGWYAARRWSWMTRA
ncbi:ABC transporter permease subunit, partial [Alicyclobacillus sp.]|uniref:ABC transporter permease subunit n=1 Tax=Alicyclobacillus sp. TaxID=61169 RepID=UPI0025BAACED